MSDLYDRFRLIRFNQQKKVVTPSVPPQTRKPPSPSLLHPSSALNTTDKEAIGAGATTSDKVESNRNNEDKTKGINLKKSSHLPFSKKMPLHQIKTNNDTQTSSNKQLFSTSSEDSNGVKGFHRKSSYFNTNSQNAPLSPSNGMNAEKHAVNNSPPTKVGPSTRPTPVTTHTISNTIPSVTSNAPSQSGNRFSTSSSTSSFISTCASDSAQLCEQKEEKDFHKMEQFTVSCSFSDDEDDELGFGFYNHGNALIDKKVSHSDFHQDFSTTLYNSSTTPTYNRHQTIPNNGLYENWDRVYQNFPQPTSSDDIDDYDEWLLNTFAPETSHVDTIQYAFPYLYQTNLFKSYQFSPMDNPHFPKIIPPFTPSSPSSHFEVSPLDHLVEFYNFIHSFDNSGNISAAQFELALKYSTVPLSIWNDPRVLSSSTLWKIPSLLHVSYTLEMRARDYQKFMINVNLQDRYGDEFQTLFNKMNNFNTNKNGPINEEIEHIVGKMELDLLKVSKNFRHDITRNILPQYFDPITGLVSNEIRGLCKIIKTFKENSQKNQYHTHKTIVSSKANKTESKFLNNQYNDSSYSDQESESDDDFHSILSEDEYQHVNPMHSDFKFENNLQQDSKTQEDIETRKQVEEAQQKLNYIYSTFRQVYRSLSYKYKYAGFATDLDIDIISQMTFSPSVYNADEHNSTVPGFSNEYGGITTAIDAVVGEHPHSAQSYRHSCNLNSNRNHLNHYRSISSLGSNNIGHQTRYSHAQQPHTTYKNTPNSSRRSNSIISQTMSNANNSKPTHSRNSIINMKHIIIDDIDNNIMNDISSIDDDFSDSDNDFAEIFSRPSSAAALSGATNLIGNFSSNNKTKSTTSTNDENSLWEESSLYNQTSNTLSCSHSNKNSISDTYQTTSTSNNLVGSRPPIDSRHNSYRNSMPIINSKRASNIYSGNSHNRAIESQFNNLNFGSTVSEESFDVNARPKSLHFQELAFSSSSSTVTGATTAKVEPNGESFPTNTGNASHRNSWLFSVVGNDPFSQEVQQFHQLNSFHKRASSFSEKSRYSTTSSTRKLPLSQTLELNKSKVDNDDDISQPRRVNYTFRVL